MTNDSRSPIATFSRRRAIGLTGIGVAGAVGAVGVVGSQREAPSPLPARQAAPTTVATQPSDSSAVTANAGARRTMAQRATPTPTPPPFEGVEETSVRELGRALTRKQISAVELVEEMTARIEAMDEELDGNEGLRAVIELNPDAAELAAELDDELARGGSRGPLHGIPVLLKDTFATGDKMRTTAGSLALVDNPGAADAFVVERLREAGAIILGKSNLTEWSNFRGSSASSGWSGRGGQTRNPYHLDMSPWGSSSGSGVGVAASYAPLALGVETNGSIMTPASACGIVGFKPTVGLVSRRGVVPISFTQDSPGPMARSVEDAALLLNAIAGHDPKDPAYSETDWSAPANAFEKFPVPKVGKVDYTKGLDEDGLKGVRIGVCRSLWGNDAAADAVAEEALVALEEAGARLIDDVSIPNQGAVGAD
ncbi:MAG: amidase family protein, partial [Chloroflexota bacterium]|nr:amidase family protein [Chloroflexota bacterium]